MECTVQLVYTCSPSDIINIVDITNITYIQSAQRNNTTSRDWSYNWDLQATAQLTVNDMNSWYLSCHCGGTQWISVISPWKVLIYRRPLDNYVKIIHINAMRCSKIIGVLLLITNLRILILMSGLSASVIFIPSSYRRKKEKMLEESNLYNETEYLQ